MISKYTPRSDAPWIGFDFDGTIARNDTGSIDTLGDPIMSMISRIENYLKVNTRVKIFTARANDPAQIAKIQKWLVDLGLPALEVTDRKDYLMIRFYDDRAVAVIPNTGRLA